MKIRLTQVAGGDRRQIIAPSSTDAIRVPGEVSRARGAEPYVAAQNRLDPNSLSVHRRPTSYANTLTTVLLRTDGSALRTRGEEGQGIPRAPTTLAKALAARSRQKIQRDKRYVEADLQVRLVPAAARRRLFVRSEVTTRRDRLEGTCPWPDLDSPPGAVRVRIG